MKNLCLLLLCLCTVPIVAKGRKSQKMVIIDCGDTLDTTGYKVAKPLRDLARALTTNARSQKFQVLWVVAFPDGSTDANVYYERDKHTLTFYSKSEMWGLGNENLKPAFKHWRLKRVRDAMIVKLASKHKRDFDEPGDSFFSDLTKLGANRF